MAGAPLRGEVRWYRFLEPDKRRPVVVLTRDTARELLGEITIAPVSTRIRESPTEVPLTRDDGMPRDCAVNLDHVQTVASGKLGALITTLDRDHMDQMRDALLFALGFDD